MSNSPVSPNNMRRPPMRPNPNLAKARPQPNVSPRPPYGPRPNINQVPPRPKPQRQEQKPVENNAPTAQDMFASLSQAYNNMINNLQFMNAVGIVSGIYQNATQMQNQNRFANPFPMTPEQIRQQMEAYMASGQIQNGAQSNTQPNMKDNPQSNQSNIPQYEFYQNINNAREKQAFFDEFYAYLTNRMANDNLFIRGQAHNVGAEAVKAETASVGVKPENTKFAESEARKQGLSLVDYLNKVCNEVEFSQFDNYEMPQFENVQEQSPSETYELSVSDNGEFVEMQEYSTKELMDALNGILNENQVKEESETENVDESNQIDENQSLEENGENGEDTVSSEQVNEESESSDDIESLFVNDNNDENDEIETDENVDSDIDVSIFESDDNGLQSNDNEDKQNEEASEEAVAENEQAPENEESAETENVEDNNNNELNENPFEDDNEFYVDEEPEEVDFDDEEDNELSYENGSEDDEHNSAVEQDREQDNNLNINLSISEENGETENVDEDSESENGVELDESEQGDNDEEAEEDEDYSDIIVDEDGEISHTMTAKVLNAEDDIKVIYNDIKNYLLSYKGIKSRYSSACESFRLSRKLMAKFVIIGRTVKLYLALDPSEFPNNIYHQKDESKKKAYIDVPFMVKVKSNLSIRKAKELIDKMMQENDLVKNFKYKEKDYVEVLRQSLQEDEN